MVIKTSFKTLSKPLIGTREILHENYIHIALIKINQFKHMEKERGKVHEQIQMKLLKFGLQKAFK